MKTLSELIVEDITSYSPEKGYLLRPTNLADLLIKMGAKVEHLVKEI